MYRHCEKVGVNVDVSDIDRSHRVGRKETGKPRPNIVKFVSYRERSELFQSKELLKGCGFIIREDLTKQSLYLLNECILKYGLPNVWTLDGVINVKRGDTKYHITCRND